LGARKARCGGNSLKEVASGQWLVARKLSP
jgi:hypothetical protein